MKYAVRRERLGSGKLTKLSLVEVGNLTPAGYIAGCTVESNGAAEDVAAKELVAKSLPGKSAWWIGRYWAVS